MAWLHSKKDKSSEVSAFQNYIISHCITFYIKFYLLSLKFFKSPGFVRFCRRQPFSSTVLGRICLPTAAPVLMAPPRCNLFSSRHPPPLLCCCRGRLRFPSELSSWLGRVSANVFSLFEESFNVPVFFDSSLLSVHFCRIITCEVQDSVSVCAFLRPSHLVVELLLEIMLNSTLIL